MSDSQICASNMPGESSDAEDVCKPLETASTFKELGVADILCQACNRLNWETPTKIQQESIPAALSGRDIIGLAETGSGKTGAFALPILQSLLDSPQRLFALVLTPTRELAFQICEQFEALGKSIQIKCLVIVGGVDKMTQSLALTRKPHIIIATPGRMADHLETTKGFSLSMLKFLVMDEADRILNMDFEEEVNKILKLIPRERTTYLYSATMTQKVRRLQRASLKNPAKVQVSDKYQTVEKLSQSYICVPLQLKDLYLVYVLKKLKDKSAMIFLNTCANTQRVKLLLRSLGIGAVSLNGQMTQPKRLEALEKFKKRKPAVIVVTDVASRGLDIAHVDVVINMDIPMHCKDYIHRVGRTARAGRKGTAISFVAQYDLRLYQKIEELICKRLPLYPVDEKAVTQLKDTVTGAQYVAKKEMKKYDFTVKSKKRKMGEGADDDTEESTGVRRKMGLVKKS